MATVVHKLRHRTWGTESGRRKAGGTETNIKQWLLVKGEGDNTTHELLKQKA